MRPTREVARELRGNRTTAEAVLWECLRARQLDGWKFRRQHPVSDFIVDFYCAEADLVVEVDGGVHDEPTQRERDQLRDGTLAECGYQVLRVGNATVLDSLEVVRNTIATAIAERANKDRS